MPYKQRVRGSNPCTPTRRGHPSETYGLFLFNPFLPFRRSAVLPFCRSALFIYLPHAQENPHHPRRRPGRYPVYPPR